jgi:hypothetical protein
MAGPAAGAGTNMPLRIISISMALKSTKGHFYVPFFSRIKFCPSVRPQRAAMQGWIDTMVVSLGCSLA